jgi:prepilin-type N-terminal cleavage/methylation domain-containing protein
MTGTITTADTHQNRSFGISSLDISRQAGLTLVEMLVALVLSSIIFISAYQVISNLVQYQVRARVHNDRELERILFDNLFGQIIEKGINQYDLFYYSQKSTMFVGTENSLQLISRAYSDRFDKPGHRVYRLFLRGDELFISYRAFDQDYLSNIRHELATGLKASSLTFAYLENDRWVNEWSDQKSIPEFVRIKADLDGAETAEWIRGTSLR